MGTFFGAPKSSMIDSTRAVLVDEARTFAERVPTAKWFLFGSVLRDATTANDIDVLIVSDSHDDVQLLRRELRSLCIKLPLHLLLATREEESELKFIAGQGCQQIYPVLGGKDGAGRNARPPAPE